MVEPWLAGGLLIRDAGRSYEESIFDMSEGGRSAIVVGWLAKRRERRESEGEERGRKMKKNEVSCFESKIYSMSGFS